MENYLVDNYSLDSIEFSKPKKHSEYYYSRIKYSLNNQLINLNIQLPVMSITTINDKGISLEFMRIHSEYSKKCYNFLSNLENIILDSIIKNTAEWFGKEIPMESIRKMYHPFLKAPKNADSNVSIDININKSKFYDSKNREISLSDIKENNNSECICHLKYLVFSKDTAFLVWELLSCKVYKKINRVKQYGFIEDPEDYSFDSDDLDLPELNQDPSEKNNTFF
jgi:hypothetical protein